MFDKSCDSPAGTILQCLYWVNGAIVLSSLIPWSKFRTVGDAASFVNGDNKRVTSRGDCECYELIYTNCLEQYLAHSKCHSGHCCLKTVNPQLTPKLRNTYYGDPDEGLV